MKKILITGAGGFVGTHLIHALKSLGDTEIYAAVYKSTSDITELIPEDHIITGDLTDFTFAQKLIEIAKPQVVYHLAALSVVHSSAEQAISVMNGNTAISYNILEAIRLGAPMARVIAISSGNVYGAVQDADRPIIESTPLRPLNPYAISKVTQEMLALQYYLAYGLDVVILRPFNHTGVGQTTDFVIPRLAEQFAAIENGSEPVIEVGNLDTIRDFTDVSDMVDAYIMASEKGQSGEIYNIGSGKGHTIAEILDILKSLSKAKVEIKIASSLVRRADVPVLVADASKFAAQTDWKPKISLDQTISDILENYRIKQ
jgi:GDP-4-dehydro-6-deoxy-D-mannose reductase